MGTWAILVEAGGAYAMVRRQQPAHIHKSRTYTSRAGIQEKYGHTRERDMAIVSVAGILELLSVNATTVQSLHMILRQLVLRPRNA